LKSLSTSTHYRITVSEMSRLDENDLIGKFISALTIFSERSAALEARVLGELGCMRGDINQLKQAVLNESAVSVPQVMEQQRMTMIELIRQIHPLIAVPQSVQQAPVQPPTIAVAPTQQPIIQHQQPIVQPQQAPKSVVVPPQSVPKQVQPPSNVAPIQPQQSGFGSEFTLKDGEWYCTGCYVKNAAGSNECLCCQTPRSATGQSSSPQKPAFKPQSFTGGATNLFSTQATQPTQSTVQKPVKEEKPPVSFSFTPNKTAVTAPTTQTPSIGLFGGSAQKPADQKPQAPVSFSFAPTVSKSSSTTTVAPQENKPLFGTAISPPSNTKPLFGGGAGNASFSSLAGGNNSFLNKSGSNASTFNADPKQFAVFGGVKATSTVTKKQDGNEEDGAEEIEPEEFVPDDSQLKRPDIALPDLVEVTTGEENEEVLFSARCRLYRFMSGAEVKERGTGDLKLLKNRETGKVRCVMRREQVLKLCANFGIPTGFTVNNTKRGENILTWACRDYSDPETPDGENMTLICRFKDIETANKFKQIVEAVTV